MDRMAQQATEHTIVARIAEHARSRPGHPAVIFEDTEVSWARLHEDSNRAAHALRAHGAGRGARVAYIGRESHHYYTLAVACAKAGAVLVPVNWRLTAGEVNHILRDSGAALLFAEDEFLPVVARSRPDGEGCDVIEVDSPQGRYTGFTAWLDKHPGSDPGFAPTTDEPVAQMYTSGTTGLPKGVVLAHRTFFTFIDNMRRAGADWIDWLPEDRSLSAFPGLHAGGYAWFMHCLNVGATSVVLQTFVAEDAVRAIERHGVTTLWAAPAMLQMMLVEPGVTRATFRSLRKTVYGGSPIHRELLLQCMEGFAGELVQAYAAAETGSFITCLRADEHVADNPKLASAGRLCPGNELRIVDEDGRTLGPGEPGRICVRTPAEFVEYWHRPDETARMKRDGWLYMGDSGYLDEDGYLFLRDRINDTIIVAGQNIYPVEVEDVIRTHPAVDDVAVFGVPHPRWGEVVRAAVVTRDGEALSGRDLMKYLRGRLAGFKIPIGYDFVAELPRNPTGKVLRRVLRAGV
jgi:fatty-acyl-CoA synthase